MAVKLENNTQIEGENMRVMDENRWIPRDVIDEILSRLPVKYQIRFQSLSKLHKSTVLNPWFWKISYIHQSNKSRNLLLLLTDEMENLRLLLTDEVENLRLEGARIGFALVRLEGENFKTVMELGNPFGAAIPLCCCNGMVLLALKWPGEGLVLWNPSIRRHTMIPSPPDLIAWFDDSLGPWLHFGFYHDLREDDYKVVIISMEYNLVFSCKTTTWAKEVPSPFFRELDRGVFLDGCFYYWQNECEVAYFDFRKRELGMLKVPDMKTNPTDDKVTLIALNGHLCVYYINRDGTKFQAWVMQKLNCSWTELNNLENTGPHFSLSGQFSIGTIFSIARSDFIMYNHLEKRFEISSSLSDVKAIHLVPYSESLFFPF